MTLDFSFALPLNSATMVLGRGDSVLELPRLWLVAGAVLVDLIDLIVSDRNVEGSHLDDHQ